MIRHTFALVACALLGILPVTAQNPATGFPPYGSFQDGAFDAVNRQNVNVNFAIPIVSSPGRGMDLNFAVVYNSLVWAKSTSGSTTSWQPVDTQWGWTKFVSLGKVANKTQSKFCNIDFEVDVRYYNWEFIDAAGTRHPFSLDFWEGATACNFGPTGPRTGYATDGSGYYLDLTDYPASTWTARTPGGHKIVGGGSINDPNGNRINTGNPPVTSAWRDTLGRDTLKTSSTSTYVKYEVLDKNGTYQTFMLNLQTFNIKTNFGCAGVVEKTTTASLPVSLVLPNGKSYQFEYEVTPGYPTYKTGRIKKVTLPSGGYYEYEYPAPNNGINCADGTVRMLKRRINDGTSTSEWVYDRAVFSKTIVMDPVGNQSTFTFSGAKLTAVKVYAGTEASGALLRTVTNTWATNGTPASSTTVLEDDPTKPTSKLETDYDTYGNLLEIREYAFGPGAVGGLVRKTTNTYATVGFIKNRVSQTIVRDGSGTIVSRTDIAHDTTSLTNVTGAAQHDDTNYGIGFTARGNPTAVTTYTDPATPSGGVTRYFHYDTLGNLRKADVNCCQQKQWSFSATSQYAYPDSVTSGPPGSQLSSSATYNFQTGLVATSTDENGQQTTYTYDVYKRLTQVSRPGPGSTTITVTHTYDDNARTVTTTSPIEGTNVLTQVSYFDQLGRLFKQSSSAPEGASYVETQFDIMGRPYKSSNPYRTGDTVRWTETQFDVLGRATKVIPPDGSPTTNHTLYEYLGATVTVTEPTGKKRKSEANSLGQLIKLTEPDVNSGNALTQETTYAYNTLGLLTQVSQGVQTRTYQYDGMGRLTQQATPEGGNWSYQYNAFNLVTQRTDARSVDTNYTYDALNRLKTVSYDVSGTSVPATPTVEYFYDEGGAAANALGRLTRVTVGGVNDEIYQYDQLGRMTQVQKVIGGTTYTTAYGYNLAGELTSLTYPSGRVVTQNYDAVGRLSTIQSGGTNYVSGFGYNAAGQVTAFNYGNGVAASFGYTPERLQLQNLTYSKSGQNLFSLTYCYWQNCDTQSGGNNGQVTRISDNVVPGRTVNYTYDALHRLKTAVTSGGGGYNQWGLSWTHDRYGNRTAQTVTAGTAPSNSVTIDSNTNRITGSPYNYDANGNMTNDGLNTLVYDAENHVASVNGGATTYGYDAVGMRVRKTIGANTTAYIFSGSKVIAEYFNGAWSKDYVYMGGQLVVTEAARFSLKTSQGGNVACNNTTFGDPMIGVVKSCYTNDSGGSGSTPTGYSLCANENGTCTFTGTKDVAYGANGQFILITNVTKSIACNNQTFGDPVYGVVKACYIRDGGGGASAPSGYTYCAAENGTCGVSGTKDVAYGMNGPRYHINDHLSMRVIADSNGAIVSQSGHYPYGESWYETGGANKLKFTSYERDSETGNDYAIFRFHVNRLGRFSSTDRLAGSTADPQSLNLFSYVGNSPINFTDPLGLVRTSFDGEEEFRFLTPGLGGWGSGWQIGASCTADRVDMPCGVVLAILASGGGVQCNDDCPPRHAHGETWWPEVHGNGRGASYPSTRPGARFDTNDEALIAGARWAQAQSFDQGFEHCGLTYRTGSGNYSFSSSVEGNIDSCRPQSATVPNHQDSFGPIQSTVTGGYHGHGRDDPRYESNRLSGQPGDGGGDTYWADWMGRPISLGTPGGHVIIYYPLQGCQRFIQGSPAGTGTTIPVCP